MSVGGDQLHAVQAAGGQRAQEPGPERAGLAVADIEAEHLAAAVGADPGRDHHRLGGHPADPATAVPPVRALQNVASRNTYGNAMPASERSAERGHLDVASAQIRDTSLREIRYRRRSL